MEQTKIIRVVDAFNGKFVEESTAKPVQIEEARIPYPRKANGRMTINIEEAVNLQEAPGGLETSNFPDALRMGIQFDAFASYAETPTTYQQFVRTVNSDKQQEEYLFDSPVGLPPIVAEGMEYPEAVTDFDSGVTIRNHKRGMKISVTEEMQMFDKVGKVRELAELVGRSMRLGEEQDVMNVVTTTGNYTRTNTAGDNDESATGAGANTQDLTFSPAGLIAAFNILRTMKDRRTGVYLNVMPDTMIVAPKLWWAVQMLVQSPNIMRVGGSSTAEIYGTGTNNAFFNVISKIIVSPQFGNGYQWALMESGRAITFQRVLPMQILIGSKDASNATYMARDVIQYRARNYYGVGMRDDRFAFFSNSTTAPTIG